MSNDTDLVCSICLCDIDNISKNIIKTECCHIFHSNCFLKNVAFNGFNCPNCRTILYDENNDDNYSEEDDGYEEDDDYEEDYTDEQYEEFEAERIRLNGSRWLFMRAEGIEIHHDDNDKYDDDEYNYDNNNEEDEYDNEYNNEQDEDYDNEDEDYDNEDDEDYYEEDDEEKEEYERIILNGSRWLFMRAEGIEIHRFDNDDYEFDENDYNYEDYNLEDNNLEDNNQNNNQNNNLDDNYEDNYEDNYDFVRESDLAGINISINDIAEKIIQKGVTYKELLVLLIGFNIFNESDVVEYSRRQLNEIKEMIYNISDGISN